MAKAIFNFHFDYLKPSLYLLLVIFVYVGVYQVVRIHPLFVFTWDVGCTPISGNTRYYWIPDTRWFSKLKWLGRESKFMLGSGRVSLCVYLSVYLYLFVWICVCVYVSLCFFVFVLGCFYACVCVCVCLFLFVYMCVKTCVIGLSPPPMYCLSNETDRWLQLVLAFVKMIQSQKRSIQNRWDKRCS